MTSYLSPLSQYIAPLPRLRRSRSSASFLDTPLVTGSRGPDLGVGLSPAYSYMEWQPTLVPHHPHRLRHPLYSKPERYWRVANGHQRIVSTSSAYVPPNRRDPRSDPLLPEWTVRHYSTLPLVCARPSTVNRYYHVTPNRYWDDRINFLLGDIGRIARSMKHWASIKPERRYMFRTLAPTHMPRSVSTTDIAFH